MRRAAVLVYQLLRRSRISNCDAYNTEVDAFQFFCFTAAAASAETFVFTAIPDEDETKLVERFRGVADYLSEQLNVDVRYIPVKSYAAAVSAFRNNQVQLAWFGGLSGVQARRLVPGAEAIAQGVEDEAFETYFIANTNTGIEPAAELSELKDQLQGKTFTFGSKGSTSGRLMPEFYVRDTFGAKPDDFFRALASAATIPAPFAWLKPVRTM